MHLSIPATSCRLFNSATAVIVRRSASPPKTHSRQKASNYYKLKQGEFMFCLFDIMRKAVLYILGCKKKSSNIIKIDNSNTPYKGFDI
jgi:hypothetical protein